jgi:hypothetical protein
MLRFLLNRRIFRDEDKMGVQDFLQDSAACSNEVPKCAEPSDYDPLLPVQYYERMGCGRSPSGEFKLFFAILEDALRCYVRAKNCRTGSKRAEFVDARKWFRTRGTRSVFSFESVCGCLGIDPDWLRARLEAMAPSDLPLKQFRTRRRHLARPRADQRRGYRPGAPQSDHADQAIACEAVAMSASGSGMQNGVTERSLDFASHA